MSIEVILFVVIVLVFGIDFVLKGRKKSDEKFAKKIEITKQKKVLKKNQPNFKKLFHFFIKRPKNSVLFILSVLSTKLLINYLIYPTDFCVSYGNCKYQLGYNRTCCTKREIANFGEHIENIFIYENHLFISSIILCSILVWYFNDKIKAK